MAQASAVQAQASAVQAQASAAPFTKLIVNTKEDIGIMSEWISTKMEKNEDLPPMPLELWRLIVSMAILQKRKDAVILGDYVLRNIRTGVDIAPMHWYIRTFGQESLETIQRKTFGSKVEDERWALELFSGNLSMKSVLEIKN